MLHLDITPEEKASRRMVPAHLEAAVAALEEDGAVVLRGVVDSEHIAALRDKMLADVDEILRLPQPPYQFTLGHIQHDPPPFPPYLFRDVLLNDMAVCVTKAMLGAGLRNTFYSGNTNLPGSGAQPVHPDTAQLWPDLPAAHPPYAFVVNVPVVDMDESNGSTELWPGTHRDTTMWEGMGTLRVPEAKLAEWRARRPPIQPAVAAGSIVIRDIRLWHRGVPNHTDRPRPMIAMIHRIHWWRGDGRIRFPIGTESLFEHSDLTTNAVFVDGPIDYLRRHRPYDLAEEAVQNAK